MSRHTRLRAVSPVAMAVGIACAFLAGCETVPTDQPNRTVTMSAQVPQMTALDQTEQRQRKGEVTVMAAGQTYGAEQERRTRVEQLPPPPPWVSPRPSEQHVYVEQSREPVLVVTPDRLEFLLTITNHGDRVLRTRGAVMELNVDGRTLAVREQDYQGLLDAVIPPGGQRQVSLYGPSLDRMPDAGVIGMFLYDVPIERDEAGNVVRVENFEWYFEYDLRTQSREAEVQTDRGWMHQTQYHQLRRHQGGE